MAELQWSLGELIRKARESASMEQLDLALAIGVSRPQVSKWERNKAVPSVFELLKISEATGADWLWTAAAESPPTLAGRAGPCWSDAVVLSGSRQPVAA